MGTNSIMSIFCACFFVLKEIRFRKGFMGDQIRGLAQENSEIEIEF